MTVKLEELFSTYTYAGSVTSAGLQTFTLDDELLQWGTIRTLASSQSYYLIVEGSGSRQHPTECDSKLWEGLRQAPAAYRFLRPELAASARISQLSLSGHQGATPEIVYGDVISSPEDGTAYAAGERIEMLYCVHS